MSARSFKLALIQLHVVPGKREENLSHATDLIHEAARAGAQVVLLPEALPYGWMDPGAKIGADGIPEGRDCTAFRDAARESGVFVCTGLVERAGQQIFNAAVLIDPRGSVILHHRKIFELEIAHDLYALGDRIGVVDTQLGPIGLMICADGFAPGQTVSRALGLMGAEVILSPCAWAVPPNHDNGRTPYGKLWIDNYGPVAKDCGLWIAGCSNVGPVKSGAWAGHKCIGCSMVVGPTGDLMLQAPYGEEAEEISYLQIDLPTTRVRASAS